MLPKGKSKTNSKPVSPAEKQKYLKTVVHKLICPAVVCLADPVAKKAIYFSDSIVSFPRNIKL